MWIIVQLDEPGFRKRVYEVVAQVVQELGGQVAESSSLSDVVVLATFSHRKYRTVERTVTGALNCFPVKRTIVAAQDPYVLRNKTSALTMELYGRQDEWLGAR